jgi:AbrB family looped-hinge helix DNA binding protein
LGLSCVQPNGDQANPSRAQALLIAGGPRLELDKGQVTIPAEIRKKLGLKKGDLVAFVETEEGVLISPQEVIATQALDQIGQALKEKGVTLRT